MLTYYGKTYLTTTEAAKLTNYSSFHIQRLAKEGKIEARKIGKIWAVCKQSVLSYEPTFDKPMIGKKLKKSRYTSKSTMITDRPLLSDEVVLTNEEKLKEIQNKAAFALYVDVDGNVISTIERVK
jgi:excisionase family DNA binding protein